MRIGILTFHEIYNPGAYLQAYATMKLLEEMGHEAVIIDYTSPMHRFRPWRTLIQHPQVLVYFRNWVESFGRNHVFADCQRYLNKTSRLITRTQVRLERFDAVLIGSDIVWNYQMTRLGQDPIYFGEDLNTDRLIAFAPSCGALDLSQPVPDFVQKGLHRFHAIAVRDRKTADLVEMVIGRRPEIIADPTLVLNISELPEVHNYEDDYLLVYALPGAADPATQNAIIDFARKKYIKTVAVCYRQNWVDENHICANPFEWLGRINNAKYIFTTTFHGTIFALKAGKSFAVKYNALIDSKTRPLIELLSRQDRVWEGSTDLSVILDASWDIVSTRQKMGFMANRIIRYLEDALAGRYDSEKIVPK